MTPKEYFMLTARQYDRAQRFYETSDKKLCKEAKEFEKQQLAEFIHVAKNSPEMAAFFKLECPLIDKRVQMAIEREKKEETSKLQQSLFN